MGVKVLKIIDYRYKDLKYRHKDTKRINAALEKKHISLYEKRMRCFTVFSNAPKKKYMSLYEKRMRCITVFFYARKRLRSMLFVPNYIEFNSDLTLGKKVSLPAIILKHKRKISREKAVNIKISKC